ncbi:hypothetical protein P3T26_001805 [Streptomyces sp. MAA16]|nr:hypothetical protein [Streptomyces sp. MAA16]
MPAVKLERHDHPHNGVSVPTVAERTEREEE